MSFQPGGPEHSGNDKHSGNDNQSAAPSYGGGQGAYGQSGYQGGYEQGGYGIQQPGYSSQPSYGQQPGYGSQPGYNAQPGYTPAQPNYAANPGYGQRPGQFGGYGQQPTQQSPNRLSVPKSASGLGARLGLPLAAATTVLGLVNLFLGFASSVTSGDESITVFWFYTSALPIVLGAAGLTAAASLLPKLNVKVSPYVAGLSLAGGLAALFQYVTKPEGPDAGTGFLMIVIFGLIQAVVAIVWLLADGGVIGDEADSAQQATPAAAPVAAAANPYYQQHSAPQQSAQHQQHQQQATTQAFSYGQAGQSVSSADLAASSTPGSVPSTSSTPGDTTSGSVSAPSSGGYNPGSGYNPGAYNSGQSQDGSGDGQHRPGQQGF